MSRYSGAQYNTQNKAQYKAQGLTHYGTHNTPHNTSHNAPYPSSHDRPRWRRCMSLVLNWGRKFGAPVPLTIAIFFAPHAFVPICAVAAQDHHRDRHPSEIDTEMGGALAALSALPHGWVLARSGAFVQGHMVRLKLAEGVSMSLNDEDLPIVKGWTVFGFDRDYAGSVRLGFSKAGQTQALTIAVAARRYDIQRIDGLPPQYVSPPASAMARIRAERDQKKMARAQSEPRVDFSNTFIWPLRGTITGVFGSQRFYNGEGRRPHYGVDIAAPAGTAIVASAPGRVSLAEDDMYFEGGLIFIDHGLGVTSIYMHLGDVLVTPGQMVVAGQTIGRVGSTGRSTGAHLDWRIQWRGQNLDPQALVAE